MLYEVITKSVLREDASEIFKMSVRAEPQQEFITKMDDINFPKLFSWVHMVKW